MEKKNVLLSCRDVQVQFRVRGRILTAIRGISLDIYEDECIAIVGESGSGKSVFTKTFAGMLDSNGFVSEGSLLFNDPELADTVVTLNDGARRQMEEIQKQLDAYAKLVPGAKTHRALLELESEMRKKSGLSDEERDAEEKRLKDLKAQRADLYNLKQTIDSGKEKERYKAAKKELKSLDAQIKELEKKDARTEKERRKAAAQDAAFQREYREKKAALAARYAKETAGEASEEAKKRNEILTREIYLSVGRYGARARRRLIAKLLDSFKKAFELGLDLDDEKIRNDVFDEAVFRVKYLDETKERLHGTCVINLAKVKYAHDWEQIRGRKIATVFQDPMTSLNPIITIGKQITSIIMKHQKVTEAVARKKALELMNKVGIPNAEARFDDYPFQYSGGMRQRIVIAIALSCQPKILICDEPTTALDVTIQAQILQLIKDLQKEFHYTTVFITHDLGVVANVADRVAVLYAGQIVELATVEELFFDPRHPYTWALLSSLPQLAERNTKLYSITGTPPSLYNKITGDAFAPRNPYCMKIDTLEEPPMFQVSETHFAKTWLLAPQAPQIEKPEGIRDIHGKLMESFHI